MREIPYGLFRVSARVAATFLFKLQAEHRRTDGFFGLNIYGSSQYMDHLIAERLHGEYLHSCFTADAPSSVVEQHMKRMYREYIKNERE